MDKNTNTDLKLTITALQNFPYKLNLKEIHQINLEKMNCNHKTEPFEDFWLKFRNLAMKAFPTPADQPAESFDKLVTNDQHSVGRENCAN